MFLFSVLPILEGAIQAAFVWYVMLFPVILVVSFFLTLNFNHKVLYAPTDFDDERNFMETLSTNSMFTSGDVGKVLRDFWKPKGLVDKEHERVIRQWFNANGLDTMSLTIFMRNKYFADARRTIVSELNL